MDAAELEETLRAASRSSARLLWLGALLRGEVSGEIIVVGGSAIEVYTKETYISEDVDLVGNRERIGHALSSWNFVKEGRLWSHRKLELWVDPVGEDYSGDRRKLREFMTPFGSVSLASVEDLIAKRLVEIAVWPNSGPGLSQQARLLAAEYNSSLDWAYVMRVAARDGAGRLVDDLRRKLGLDPLGPP